LWWQAGIALQFAADAQARFAETVSSQESDDTSGEETIALIRLNTDVAEASEGKLAADEQLGDSLAHIQSGVATVTKELDATFDLARQLLALLQMDVDRCSTDV
jgi:hypothetical protein